MLIMKRSLAPAVVLALVLTGGSSALAACGQVAEVAVEQAAEQALGTDSNVELEGDGVTVTDAEGNSVAVGGDVAMPDNWPSTVPLFDGGMLSLVSVDADGTATALWSTPQDPQQAADAYGTALEAAGFAADSRSAFEGMAGGEYAGNGYRVSVVAVGAEDGNSLMITAVPE